MYNMDYKNNISIPHEAVLSFIKRFNNRAVFSDNNISCPNILDSKSSYGCKIASFIKAKYVDKNGYIQIDTDDFYKLNYGQLKTLLKMCYIYFSTLVSVI